MTEGLQRKKLSDDMRKHLAKFLSPWFYRVVRVSLGLLFAWAGAVKLMDPRSFARVISGYDLLPDGWLAPVALGLPALELLAGAGLVCNIRGSLKVVGGLATLFLAVLGYGILRQLDVDCGCFSTAEIGAQQSLRTAFLRDLGLVAAVIYLFSWRRVQARTGKGQDGNSNSTSGEGGKGTMVKARSFRLWFAMIGLATFCLANSASALEWGTKELENEKLSVKFHNDVVKGGYKIVTTEELKGWMDKKEDMLLIDTMPYADSYKKNHLPGAVQFEFPIEDMTQMDDKTKADFEKLLGPDKHRKLVFYCGFTKCTRSHNGALWAIKLGYTDVYRYPGGIKAWMEADYPVEKSQ